MQKLLDALEAGTVVITATPAQARLLRHRHDTLQRRSGATGWRSPAVLSLRSWLEAQWERAVLVGAPAGERLLLSNAQVDCIWRGLIKDRDLPGGSQPALATLLRRAWSRAQQWQIGTQALSAEATGPDQQLFASLCRDYQARCNDQGWLDPGALAAAIADDWPRLAEPQARPALLVGFAMETPELTRLTTALEHAGTEVLRHVPMASDAGGGLRFEFATRDEEAAAIADWAGWQLDRQRAISLAIAYPDLEHRAEFVYRQLLDRLQPDWRDVAPQARLVERPLAPRLADQGVVRAALIALELTAGRMDLRSFGSLLRSPYISGSEDEAGPRAMLDRRLRETQQREVDLYAIQGLVHQLAPELGRRLSAALDCRADAPRSSADAWVAWMHDFLLKVGWPGDRAFAPEEQAALTGWESLLEGFARCSPMLGQLSLDEARQTLSRQAGQASVAGPAPAAPVQLVAPADACGLAFDGLWLAGWSSNAWPQTHPALPLVPLALQRRAGLPLDGSAEALMLAQRTMTGLCASTDQLCGSSALEAESVQSLPSAALAGMTPANQSAQPWFAFTASRPAALPLESVHDDEAPALRGDEAVRGGVRVLQLQALCPARAFFELRLGAAELVQPAFGIDAALRGRLVHRALELTYAGGRETSALAHTDCIAAIDAALAQCLPPGRHPWLTPLVDIERQRLLTLVSTLIELDQARPPFAIAAVEADETRGCGPLTLRVRPDRVDEISEGRRIVFDYKTGRNFSRRAWLATRPEEPQLPLYALNEGVQGVAVIRLTAQGVRLTGVGAGDFGIDGMFEVEKFSRGEFADWRDLQGHWRASLDRLAEEFVAGDCRIDLANTAPVEGALAALARVHELAEGLQ